MPYLTEYQKRGLVSPIDRIPEFKEAGIGYVGAGSSQVLRPALMPVGLQTWIIIRERDSFVPMAPVSPYRVERPEKFSSELLSMGLSCGSTVLGGVAMAGGTAAAPLSAGASLAVTVVGYAAVAASAAQCGIGIARVYKELVDPTYNDKMDAEPWFKVTSNVLEVISMAGVVVDAGSAAKSIVKLHKVTNIPYARLLKTMGRAQRKQLAKDLARYTSNPSAQKLLARYARVGRLPEIFNNKNVNREITNKLIGNLIGGLDMYRSFNGGVFNQLTVYFSEG
jgi:hypothetical protein